MPTKQPLRLEWVVAETLDENPKNWRRHPEGQVKALSGLIGDPEIGWAGALLYNERTKRLVDGHARLKAVGPGEVVPVLIGDWSEAAEAKILATLDPLAAMALPDAAALEKLLGEVSLEGFDDLEKHLDALLAETPAEEATADAPAAAETAAPQMGGEYEFRILIDCESEREQMTLLERFQQEGLNCRGLTS